MVEPAPDLRDFDNRGARKKPPVSLVKYCTVIYEPQTVRRLRCVVARRLASIQTEQAPMEVVDGCPVLRRHPLNW
jgi:hypothetical protein